MSSAGRVEDDRTRVLQDLMYLRRPVAEVVTELARFPWDNEGELVRLTTSDAARALRSFVNGGITAGELVDWADALEVRDDVGLDARDEELLREFLSEISTPEVFRPVTPQLAWEWYARLVAPAWESAPARHAILVEACHK